jgi:hypothetical protein
MLWHSRNSELFPGGKAVNRIIYWWALTEKRALGSIKIKRNKIIIQGKMAFSFKD